MMIKLNVYLILNMIIVRIFLCNLVLFRLLFKKKQFCFMDIKLLNEHLFYTLSLGFY